MPPTNLPQGGRGAPPRARLLFNDRSPESGRRLADVMREEPGEVSRVPEAEVLRDVRDGGRRIGEDAFGLEHEPIVDDRLGGQSELTAAGAAQVRRRDANLVRVEGEG